MDRLKGIENALTEERIQKLRDAGFCFETKYHPKSPCYVHKDKKQKTGHHHDDSEEEEDDDEEPEEDNALLHFATHATTTTHPRARISNLHYF